MRAKGRFVSDIRVEHALDETIFRNWIGKKHVREG